MIAVRDAIFARVGAGDAKQNGISAFVAEMLDTASIFHVALIVRILLDADLR